MTIYLLLKLFNFCLLSRHIYRKSWTKWIMFIENFGSRGYFIERNKNKERYFSLPTDVASLRVKEPLNYQNLKFQTDNLPHETTIFVYKVKFAWRYNHHIAKKVWGEKIMTQMSTWQVMRSSVRVLRNSIEGCSREFFIA